MKDKARSLFDGQILGLFFRALRLTWRSPRLLVTFGRLAWAQVRAARRRRRQAARGLWVPPILIASITEACNLACKGCYAQAQVRHRAPGAAFTPEEFGGWLAQGRRLGISIVLLAGGEPLTRPEFLDVTARFPDLLFVLFTNGMLLNDALLARLERQPHVLPVISLEGDEAATDDRRGPGVYARLAALGERLRRRDVFWGLSLTVTRKNFTTLLQPALIRRWVQAGCRLWFLVEYVPVAPGTEDLVPTEAQRRTLRKAVNGLAARYPALFIAFPGDEADFDGCLSSGRGFLHVSSTGDLEPCPFSPVADANLKRQTLEEALRSPLLAAVRREHAQLKETDGGCALWARRDWVAGLLRDSSRAQDQP